MHGQVISSLESRMVHSSENKLVSLGNRKLEYRQICIRL